MTVLDIRIHNKEHKSKCSFWKVLHLIQVPTHKGVNSKEKNPDFRDLKFVVENQKLTSAFTLTKLGAVSNQGTPTGKFKIL